MDEPGVVVGVVGLLAEFRYLMRRFLQFSEEAAVEAGLTPQHHQMLLQLAGAPAGTVTTVGYLAERLVLRHHSVVELAKRCEEAGLVRREGHPGDRRQVVLGLSERGQAVLERLSAAHAREMHELGPQLLAVLGQLVAADRGAGSDGTSGTERTSGAWGAGVAEGNGGGLSTASSRSGEFGRDDGSDEAAQVSGAAMGVVKMREREAK